MSTIEASEAFEPIKDADPVVGGVFFIKENDVLFGRGNHTKNHPGNKYYRTLVSAVKDMYSNYPKDRKQLISDLIYECIKSLDPPGLFVHELGGDKWVEVEKKDALRKISQALREKKCLLPTEYEFGYDHKKANEEEQFQLMKALLQHVAIENRKQVPSFSHARFSTKTEMPIETLRARLAVIREKSAASSTNHSVANISTVTPCPLAKEISTTSTLSSSTEDMTDVMMTNLPPPPSSSSSSLIQQSSSTMPLLPVPEPHINYTATHLSMHHPQNHPYHHLHHHHNNHHHNSSVHYSQQSNHLFPLSFTQPINNPISENHTSSSTTTSNHIYNNESYEIASVLSTMKFDMR